MKSEATCLLILNHFFPRGFRHLLATVGSAERLLHQIPRWEQKHEWQEDLKEVECKKISLISFKDPLYPQSLLQLPDYPLLLYVKGILLPQDREAVALIGTRNASVYGKEMAERFGKELSEKGITVTSGLARGIDTAAHLGALKAGRTIAVLGSGISHIYPKENLKLADHIASQGAIISEYPMNTPPFKSHFPQRNRIVSGMSKAVVLVESPLKGGGMLTMTLGEKQGKPLFAIPGRVDMPSFEGNHAWIKSKKASLMNQPADLFPLFEIQTNSSTDAPSLLNEEEKNFLRKLPSEEKSIDELVLLTQLPVMKLNILLTRLVLKKAMKEFPGKLYKKLT